MIEKKIKLRHWQRRCVEVEASFYRKIEKSLEQSKRKNKKKSGGRSI